MFIVTNFISLVACEDFVAQDATHLTLTVSKYSYYFTLIHCKKCNNANSKASALDGQGSNE
jgi:hypothetical protein